MLMNLSNDDNVVDKDHISALLSKSISIINQNIRYVFILAFIHIYIIGHSGFISTISFINSIGSIILVPAIYGRLLWIVKDNEIKSFNSILKSHWCNYFSVTIILSIPIGIYAFALKGFLPSLSGELLLISITSIIAMLSIFVIPSVFLLHENIAALIFGIKYIFYKLTYHISLMLLAIVPIIISHIMKFFLPILLIPFGNKYSIIGIVAIGFAKNFISSYLNMLVFLTASMILISRNILIEAKVNGSD